MLTFLWGTDPHFSDVPPHSRTDDWNLTLLGKFEQMRQVAQKLHAQACLIGGDVFHIKSPSRNSHEMVRKVADLFTTFPCPMYCVPGNHDCVYGDYAHLGQQPLGVLYSTGVFKRLYDEHEATFGGPAPRVGCAPGTGFGDVIEELVPSEELPKIPKVRIVGIPFHGNEYDMERFRSIKKGDEDYLIVCAHVLASEKGGSMFENEDIVKYQDLVDLDPDLWCFGHWHEDQGIKTIGGKTFVNIGSMSRGSLSQDNLTRKPSIALIQADEKGIRATQVYLKVSPAKEVFDFHRREEEVKRESVMATFVDAIKDNLTLHSNDAPLEESVRKMDKVPQMVRERALSLLERVDD